LRLWRNFPANSCKVLRSLHLGDLANRPLSVSSALPIHPKKSRDVQDSETSRQHSKATAKFRKFCGGPACVIQESFWPFATLRLSSPRGSTLSEAAPSKGALEFLPQKSPKVVTKLATVPFSTPYNILTVIPLSFMMPVLTLCISVPLP